jgi:hypothetical protein
MKRGTIAIAAGMLALGLATLITPSKAQGPLYDRVNVSLPYSVTIGDRTLQPGDYVIQQLRDQGGNSRVLLIYSDNGMKFETSAMTIPTLDQNTPQDTKVILNHFGSNYYFDKIWIQGKNYGYEFPLPDSVKSRQNERMQPVSVAANYSTVPSTEAATTTTTTASAANHNATTTPAATTNTMTASAATNKTTTTPATTNNTTTASAANNNATSPSVATNNTATTPYQNKQTIQSAATTSGTMTAQSTTRPSTMRPSTTGSASRDYDQSAATNAATNAGTTSGRRTSMPATSAGWLMMLLGGSALSGVGTMLRRKR